MKIKKLLLLAGALMINGTVFAQNLPEQEDAIPPAAHSLMNSKITFTEGVSYAQVTRIEVQKNASNFVRENMMAGAYLTIQTQDLSFFDLTATISAYYPFYQAFNGMKQKPRNMFNYAVDGFFGATISYDRWRYIDLDFSLGMHYMFQLTDEYYMHYLGLGGMIGMELPIAKHWTLMESNYFSYDNPNLGSNKNVEPFDGAYQYHINVGLRYSKKVENPYFYLGRKS